MSDVIEIRHLFNRNVKCNCKFDLGHEDGCDIVKANEAMGFIIDLQSRLTAAETRIGELEKAYKVSRCPFCLEDDFDAMGLKHHLLAGYCHVWNTTSSLHQEQNATRRTRQTES